jgi:hypothetical protein
MFATIIIVLPSCYTGGQVHVSHSASTQVFDFATHSFSTTCALAWYTDVFHEVKPLTTGYRLALSYNLIHTSPGIPRPTLPNMHTAVSALRDILRKWSNDKYANEPENHFIAYLLQHRYSKVNLKMTALKGEDAHKISHLRAVAEEFGFALCLANVSYRVEGIPDDLDYGYWGSKRARYNNGHNEGGEAPSMGEIPDSELSMENLVELTGRPIDGVIQLGQLPLDEENLIPENPFEDHVRRLD